MSRAEEAPDDPAAAGDRPDVGDIASRPTSPAVIRFLGCEAEMAGLNTDYFTAGRTDDADLRLPDELGGDPSIVLRFSRGAEGWRVSPSDHLPIFVNQEQVTGLTSLRSGDVIRFAPGGAGMQFNIVHQNAASLASLAAKYAPRLMGEKADDTSGGHAAQGDRSAVDGMQPLRYEAGGATARERTAAEIPLPAESRRRLDPAVLVAASILIAGFVAGAAFLYAGRPAPADDRTADAPVDVVIPPTISDPEPQEPIDEQPEEQPPPLVASTPSEVEEAAKADETTLDETAPAEEPADPNTPDDDPFSDL